MTTDPLLVFNFFVLWGISLLNLVLSLTMARWLTALSIATSHERHNGIELAIGSKAPEFRAKLLSGQTVRLSSFTGSPVLFVFISSGCSGCGAAVPLLQKISPLAKEKEGVKFVLVSDKSFAETHKWATEHNLLGHGEDDLPIILAPRVANNFTILYNPNSIYPYYCLLNSDGTVRSRAPLGQGDWPRLQQEWGYAVQPRPSIVKRYS